MIMIENKKIAGIPVLEIYPQGDEKKVLPLVFFYHGWTSCKETALVNGYEIAKRGIRVVMPDALYHGERKDSMATEEHAADFWQIILQSVSEFPTLRDAYVEQEKANFHRVGVSGLSMGGITTCALLTVYKEIKSAVCLMGSPKMTEFAELTFEGAKSHGMILPDSASEVLTDLAPCDLSYHPERIAHRPFHFWHGTQDDTVPFDPTYDFYLSIQDEPWADHVSFTVTEDGHKVPYSISVETAMYFDKYL